MAERAAFERDAKGWATLDVQLYEYHGQFDPATDIPNPLNNRIDRYLVALQTLEIDRRLLLQRYERDELTQAQYEAEVYFLDKKEALLKRQETDKLAIWPRIQVLVQRVLENEYARQRANVPPDQWNREYILHAYLG